MNRQRIDDEDKLFYSFIDDEEPAESNALTLPAVAMSYTADAVKASNYNYVPASLSFFTMVGQLCKDMIAIPSGVNTDDTRLQFLWMQTSGTGKSTLTNWYMPIIREAFRLINEKHDTDFDLFDITDYTDAALIGSVDKERQEIVDDNGNITRVEVDVQIDGELAGQGLAIWDEFEYSGIFQQSQHKEKAIVYFNTFMNTLWGETWVITKKLKGGEMIECRCRRSTYGTTYIPKQLTTVITEKGVLQRMLIFIWEVPQEIQRKMRRKLIDDWGTIKEREAPLLKYSKGFASIYDTVHDRFNEVGQDPYKVLRFSKDANDALLRECILMEKYITHSRPEVFEAMETFINRILKHIEKLAVLCAVVEAPSITDRSKRFVVTQKNVLQASSLIRQCYKSLVSWLDEALRVEKRVMSEQANLGIFKSVYRAEEKDNNGWVHKKRLRDRVREETKKSQSTVYKWWDTIQDNKNPTKPSPDRIFDEKFFNKSVYVRLREDYDE